MLTSAMAGYFNYELHTDPSLDLVKLQSKLTAEPSDALRRMAIRNSYETRSLGGMVGLRCTAAPSTTHLLPPVILQPPRNRHRGERSVSPTSMRCVDSRPRSSSDQLHVLGVNKTTGGTGLKRSSSQSSVAVNKTTPTIQAGNSSYIYHTPSGRKIGNASRRKAYENVRLLVPPPSTSQSEMKRSSSYSASTANSTGLTACSKDHESIAPSDTPPRPAAVHPGSQSSGQSEVPHAWSKGQHSPKHSQAPHKSTEHTHEKLPPVHTTNHPPHMQFPLTITNFNPPHVHHFDKSLPTSRFERTKTSYSSNRLASHLMYPRSQSAAATKRVQLHAPRGWKVASLV